MFITTDFIPGNLVQSTSSVCRAQLVPTGSAALIEATPNVFSVLPAVEDVFPFPSRALTVCLWILALPGTAFANHLCLRKWSCLCWAEWSARAAHHPVLNLCISLVPSWNIPSFWAFSIPPSVTNVLPFPGKCWVLKRAALPGWCSGVIQTKFNQSVWMIFWVV